MERERFDGADVLHLVATAGASMDWQRLLRRFGSHWRVLLGHIVLFGYAFPSEREAVPRWVEQELVRRLVSDPTVADERVCWGTLLSKEQYRSDIERGYLDARFPPVGTLSRKDVDPPRASSPRGAGVNVRARRSRATGTG